jgi:predicted nucleotidyltransferase
MRETALSVMTALSAFSPRLIGSVWRGTARKGSDIDLVVLSSNPDEVAAALPGYTITERGEVAFNVGARAYHIKLDVSPHEVEVVVRDPSEYETERCDIYGDMKRGLTLSELERILRTDPLRRFVPRRGIR